MMKNTSKGLKNVSLNLCEFELLKEFSCKGLLVNSEGTEEFIQFR